MIFHKCFEHKTNNGFENMFFQKNCIYCSNERVFNSICHSFFFFFDIFSTKDKKKCSIDLIFKTILQSLLHSIKT